MMDAGRIFGRGIQFPPRVGPDGRLAWSEGEDNIREAIQIILMTEPGERVRLPEFGGGLGLFLFEPNVPATRQKIQDRITRVLEAWEPRIRVDSVEADTDPSDPSGVLIMIRYKLVATQAPGSVSLNLALRG